MGARVFKRLGLGPVPTLGRGALGDTGRPPGRVGKGNRDTLAVPQPFWQLLSCQLGLTVTHGRVWAQPCHRSLGQLWFCFWSWFLLRCNSYAK